MLEHPVIVKLSEVFHFCDATLEEPEIILLQAKAYRLDDVVDNLDDEFRMIAVQGA